MSVEDLIRLVQAIWDSISIEPPLLELTEAIARTRKALDEVLTDIINNHISSDDALG